MPNKNEVPDVDVQSLLEGDHPKFAYSETYHGQLTSENKLTYRMNENYDFGWNELDSFVCLRSNEWKLICTANDDLELVELYHIAQDPGESRNLLEEHSDVTEEFFERLHKLLADDDQRYVTGEKVDEETRDHLEDLGYL